MKRIISLALIIIMLLGLVACFEPIEPTDTTKPNNSSSTTKKPSPSVGTTTDPSKPDVSIPDETPDLGGFDTDELATFEAFFNHENHISIHLDISDSELKKIQQDYEKYSSMGSKSPIYRMADMYITITKPNGEKLEYTIEQVGVRMKGNTSRTSFYNDENGMYNLVHFKISFGETFDKAEYYGSDALVWTDDAARKARKDRTFATLEKIDMRWNRNDDPTYIRESYAYDFYRENGILAPHTNLASVGIGNDHAGVWVVYEPIDKIFLEKNLSPEALGGDLYKLGWTHDPADFTKFSSYGVEDEDAGKFYVYDLKTNKKTSDHSSLKKLIQTLNSSSLNKDRFSSIVDVDYFTIFCATSYMIGNPDDLRNNYNNCYIYFRADNGKMIIIPYDMDRGFGVNTWNPYGNGMTTDSPFQDYNVCGEQRNPLFKKTIQNNGFLKNEYVEALKVVAEHDLLKNETFKEHFDLAKSLYENDATPSKTYGNAREYNFRFDINKTCEANHSSNMSFADYMNAKKITLSKYISDYVPDVEDPGNNDNEQGGTTEPEKEPVVTKSDSEWELFLRADFNGWSNDNSCKFSKVSDGVFALNITRNQRFVFKLYDNKYKNKDKKWFGWESIAEDCPEIYDVENYPTNIILERGSYTIYFYTETNTIYIEKK